MARCQCSHCKEWFKFDESDFYSEDTGLFFNRGPTISCPHCGKDTQTYMLAETPAMPVTWLKHPIVRAVIAILITAALAYVIFFCDVGAIVTEIFTVVIALMVAAAVGAIYLIPTFAGRRKRNAAAIFVLNLFLGWTFIGWVVALVWACTED